MVTILISAAFACAALIRGGGGGGGALIRERRSLQFGYPKGLRLLHGTRYYIFL